MAADKAIRKFIVENKETFSNTQRFCTDVHDMFTVWCRDNGHPTLVNMTVGRFFDKIFHKDYLCTPGRFTNLRGDGRRTIMGVIALNFKDLSDLRMEDEPGQGVDRYAERNAKLVEWAARNLTPAPGQRVSTTEVYQRLKASQGVADEVKYMPQVVFTAELKKHYEIKKRHYNGSHTNCVMDHALSV